MDSRKEFALCQYRVDPLTLEPSFRFFGFYETAEAAHMRALRLVQLFKPSAVVLCVITIEDDVPRALTRVSS